MFGDILGSEILFLGEPVVSIISESSGIFSETARPKFFSMNSKHKFFNAIRLMPFSAWADFFASRRKRFLLKL